MSIKNSRNTHHQEANILHAIVFGKVQGVGFRVFVRHAAQQLGCTGWVRNLPDGSVEVHAHARSEVTLTELLTELYKGPPWSHVSDIDISWQHDDFQSEEDAESRPLGFRILR